RSHEAEPMPARTLNDAAAAPAALTAFLRGIERRGAVFAQLQCGDTERGDVALAVAMRAFRNSAQQLAVADWPRHFWMLLLAAPPLREEAAGARWPPAFAPLTRLGHGPRAALLLRLVAGLSESEAAAVLGIRRPTYRLALQRALPHRTDGTPDEAVWQALGETAQQSIRELPAERLAHLARVREAAILGQRVQPDRAAIKGDASATPLQWRGPALIGIAVATLLALAATFFLPRHDDGGLAGDVRVRVRPLPPADAPAATYDAATATLTHRDFALLAEPALPPAASDPAFYAWLAAQSDASRNDMATPPPVMIETLAPGEMGQPETTDVP
ncbi:MAG: hypothetical protein ABJA62_00995, partial [Luteimonas sp.]